MKRKRKEEKKTWKQITLEHKTLEKRQQIIEH